MSWLYESRWVPSEINGKIHCLRWFGRWSVVVRNTGQTSSYLDEMWSRALRRIDDPKKIRRILVLGFGTGGAIPQFYRRFPRAHIVSIEIDPVMVELASSFGNLRRFRWPEVHIGNAQDVLPELTGRFDLIVCDMFLGHDVSPAMTGRSCLEEIVRLLHPQGHLLVNALAYPEILDPYRTNFAEVSRWKFRSRSRNRHADGSDSPARRGDGGRAMPSCRRQARSTWNGAS